MSILAEATVTGAIKEACIVSGVSMDAGSILGIAMFYQLFPESYAVVRSKTELFPILFHNVS
jgi:hypothetical protein